MSAIQKYIRALSAFREDIPRSMHIWLGIIAFVVVLSLWSLLSYEGYIRPLFLPTPTSVIEETYILFTDHDLLGDMGASIYRVTVGFILAALVAIPLGVLMGSFKSIESLFTPFTAFIRYMPVAGFIPLLILWFGIGHLQKIILLFIGVFFFLLAMIVNVVSEVRQEIVDTAYTLGAKKHQIILRVILPASMPGIFDSLRTMMGAGWTYIVVAELVAAESGLGKMIMESQRFLQTSRVISGIIIIGLIGITFDSLFRISKPLLFPWLDE